MQNRQLLNHSWILALALASCISSDPNVDGFFGSGETIVEVPVPVPDSFSITITRPDADGKRVGWSSTIGGNCNPAGSLVKISGGASGAAVCGLDLKWETLIDFSSAAVGVLEVTAVLQDSNGNDSEPAVREFEKAHTDCDDPTDRAALFSGGDGSGATPYLICTVSQLSNIRTDAGTLAADFLLRNDLSLSGGGFLPITASYTGNFDGDNFVISDWTYFAPATQYVGIFQRIQTGGTVSNLRIEDFDLDGSRFVGAIAGRSAGAISNITLVDVELTTTDRDVGGIVGYTDAGGTIDQVTGSNLEVLATNDYAGGIVGYAQDNVTNVTSTGSVSGRNYVGGLVGNGILNVVLHNGTSSATVSGQSHIGGAAGYMLSNIAETIKNVSTSGIVTGTGSYIGGLAGRVGDNTGGEIINSSATGRVNATGDSSGNYDYVGGLAGWAGAITNCSATGNIVASNHESIGPTYARWRYLGGLAGYVRLDTIGSTATGNLSLQNLSAAHYVGGLVGYAFGSMERNGLSQGNSATGNILIVADSDTSQVGGLVGRSESHVLNGTATGNISITTNTSTVNYTSALVGYTSGGDVTSGAASGNILINSAGAVAYTGGISSYLTAGDVSSSNYTGTSITISSGSSVSYTGGIVGWIDNGGHLTGGTTPAVLTIDAAGAATQTGAIAGRVEGDVNGSTTTAATMTVDCGAATDYISGGVSYVDGSMINSSSTVALSVDCNGTQVRYVGGLAGRLVNNASDLSDSEHTGLVTVLGASNSSYVGGLAGRVDGSVYNSEHTGNVYSDGSYTGGLAGGVHYSLDDSHSLGHVTGASYVGGLVGYQWDTTAQTFSDCTSRGNVVASGARAGGILGSAVDNNNSYLTIDNCHNEATGSEVSAQSNYVGGLVGYFGRFGTVQNSSSIASVTSVTSNQAGGLVGSALHGLTVHDSYADGNVSSATGYAGGLIGYMQSDGTRPAEVRRSYALGNVSADGNYVGGLIGRTLANSTVVASFAWGDINGATGDFVGGLIGENYSDISNCYSAAETISGDRYVGGLVGYHRAGETITGSYAFPTTMNSTTGTNLNDFGALVGVSQNGTAVTSNSVQRSDVTYVNLTNSSNFTPTSPEGSAISLVNMATQANMSGAGLVFGAGAEQWTQMGAGGYEPAWDPGNDYLLPYLNFQP